MSEAAYAGLLHQRRETMHARVVDAIEHLYGDRIASMSRRSRAMRHGRATGRKQLNMRGVLV